jgi:hypothetical protein
MDLSYLAGFVDGEGYIGLPANLRLNRNPFYRPTLTIYNTHRGVLLQIKEFIGFGRVYTGTSRGPHCQPTYLFKADGRRIAPILEQLLPFLIVKRKQAELVLEYIARSQTRQTRKHTVEDIIIVDCVKALNARGLQMHKQAGVR